MPSKPRWSLMGNIVLTYGPAAKQGMGKQLRHINKDEVVKFELITLFQKFIYFTLNLRIHLVA